MHNTYIYTLYYMHTTILSMIWLITYKITKHFKVVNTNFDLNILIVDVKSFVFDIDNFLRWESTIDMILFESFSVS